MYLSELVPAEWDESLSYWRMFKVTLKICLILSKIIQGRQNLQGSFCMEMLFPNQIGWLNRSFADMIVIATAHLQWFQNQVQLYDQFLNKRRPGELGDVNRTIPSQSSLFCSLHIIVLTDTKLLFLFWN